MRNHISYKSKIRSATLIKINNPISKIMTVYWWSINYSFFCLKKGNIGAEIEPRRLAVVYKAPAKFSLYCSEHGKLSR